MCLFQTFFKSWDTALRVVYFFSRLVYKCVQNDGKFQAVITGAEGVIWILNIYDNELYFSDLDHKFAIATLMKTRRNGGKKK